MTITEAPIITSKSEDTQPIDTSEALGTTYVDLLGTKLLQKRGPRIEDYGRTQHVEPLVKRTRITLFQRLRNKLIAVAESLSVLAYPEGADLVAAGQVWENKQPELADTTMTLPLKVTSNDVFFKLPGTGEVSNPESSTDRKNLNHLAYKLLQRMTSFLTQEQMNDLAQRLYQATEDVTIKGRSEFVLKINDNNDLAKKIYDVLDENGQLFITPAMERLSNDQQFAQLKVLVRRWEKSSDPLSSM